MTIPDRTSQGLLDGDAARRMTQDAELRAQAVHADVTFDVAVDGRRQRFTFLDGTAATSVPAETPDGPTGDQADFTVVLPAFAWRELTSALPDAGRQSMLAFTRPGGGGEIHGSMEAFAQALPLLRRIVELARPASPEGEPELWDLTGVRSGYVRIETREYGAVNIFAERAGSGIPLVLLATAGADTRQFHGLMSDPRLTGRHELIAIDLPSHGKSSRGTSSGIGSYALTSESYRDSVLATIDALGLDRPIVVGSSMAGAIVIEIAAHAPGTIRGAVSAQAGPRIANRETPWLRNPRVNQAQHVPEWTYGLMSPRSPKVYRDDVWWGYSQGGYGCYSGDIDYYSNHWDIDRVRRLLTGEVPIVLLSGSYDYSVPPSETRALAERIPGAHYREMPELGHFPHAENPRLFGGYLLSALDHILERNAQHQTDQ